MTTPTPDVIDADIRKFLDAADRARTAKNDNQRRATRAFLINRANDLRHRRDALRIRMDAGWEWLNDHPDAEDFAIREQRLLTWIADYTRICTALQDGLDRWLGPFPALTRKAA